MDETTKRLGDVFFPYAKRETARFLTSANSINLVHYTSADAAMKILTSLKWWMRSTRCMNDFSEVDGGMQRLGAALEALGNDFREAVESCHEGMAPELGQRLQNTNAIRYGTFVASFSEHLASENQAGRLSMWRGYGGTSNAVALVIDKGIVAGDGNGLNIFASPVFYGSDDELRALLAEVIANMRRERDFLRSVDRARVLHTAYMMLAFAAISLKHHGFSEEREWRLVYLPAVIHSPALVEEVVTVSGVPQRVQSIPLVDQPDKGVHGVSVDALLKRVIVGPSQFADTIGAAFAKQLGAVGVTEPWARIVTSDIPLRT